MTKKNQRRRKLERLSASHALHYRDDDVENNVDVGGFCSAVVKHADVNKCQQ